MLRCVGAAPLHLLAPRDRERSAPHRCDPHDAGVGRSRPWWAAGTGIFATQVLGALIIGAVLAATKRKGPVGSDAVVDRANGCGKAVWGACTVRVDIISCNALTWLRGTT